jgi:hypothetical protein
MPLRHFSRRPIRSHPRRVRCSAYSATQCVALRRVVNDVIDDWVADIISQLTQDILKGEITDVYISMFCTAIPDDAE